jgi:hypothetical protein
VTARRTPRLIRTAVATAVVTSTVTVLVVSASPAFALGERGDPSGHLSAVQTLLIFLGIPLAAFAVIAFLVCLPSIVNGPRYRPGRPWLLTGTWYDGPTEALPPADAELPESTLSGGGASARW